MLRTQRISIWLRLVISESSIRLPLTMLISISIVFFSNIALVDLFPQGAPPDACGTLSPKNNHIGSRRLYNPPYYLFQYAYQFKPEQVIPVVLVPKKNHFPFKGFMVQAIKASTLEFIGHFLTGTGLSLMPECSAVTHSDSKLKNSISLLWAAPPDQHGEVIFRATIVVNKHYYYENMISQIADLPALNETEGPIFY